MKNGLSIMEKKVIENRANAVLSAFQKAYGNCVYVDAVKLARFFGFSVEEKNNLPINEDGYIVVSEDKTEKSIVVNNARSIEFKRFIIAHELAHYLLHYTGEEGLFEHRENKKGKSTEENDADYLAACVLMPAEAFKEQYKLLRKKYTPRGTVRELQIIFRTPEESVERRIAEVCR